VTARIEKVVTSGTFSLDGQDFAVDNNVWLVGDGDEVVVIDPAHDAGSILAAGDGRDHDRFPGENPGQTVVIMKKDWRRWRRMRG